MSKKIAKKKAAKKVSKKAKKTTKKAVKKKAVGGSRKKVAKKKATKKVKSKSEARRLAVQTAPVVEAPSSEIPAYTKDGDQIGEDLSSLDEPMFDSEIDSGI